MRIEALEDVAKDEHVPVCRGEVRDRHFGDAGANHEAVGVGTPVTELAVLPDELVVAVAAVKPILAAAFEVVAPAPPKRRSSPMPPADVIAIIAFRAIVARAAIEPVGVLVAD